MYNENTKMKEVTRIKITENTNMKEATRNLYMRVAVMTRCNIEHSLSSIVGSSSVFVASSAVHQLAHLTQYSFADHIIYIII